MILYYLRKWHPHARICVIYTTYATPHRKQPEGTIAPLPDSSLIIPPVQKHTLKSTQQSNEVFKSPIVANWKKNNDLGQATSSNLLCNLVTSGDIHHYVIKLSSKQQLEPGFWCGPQGLPVSIACCGRCVHRLSFEGRSCKAKPSLCASVACVWRKHDQTSMESIVESSVADVLVQMLPPLFNKRASIRLQHGCKNDTTRIEICTYILWIEQLMPIEYVSLPFPITYNSTMIGVLISCCKSNRDGQVCLQIQSCHKDDAPILKLSDDA